MNQDEWDVISHVRTSWGCCNQERRGESNVAAPLLILSSFSASSRTA
jgi:hypothetical protein